MSTRRTFRLALFVVTIAAAAGCASTGPTEVQRLQAQNAYERGLAFNKEGQPAPALSAFQEAVSLDPTHAVYRDRLGFMLLELGQVEQAIETLSKAVELDARLGDTHFHLGTALAEEALRTGKAGRWEAAVAAYQRAVALPTLTVPESAYHNLGVALYNIRKHAEAEKALRFALSLNPKLQAAYYNLGLVLVAEKRPEEAKESFRRARQLGPDSPFGQAALERLRAMGDRK